MMPFCSDGGGGDQDKLRVCDVAVIVSPCGGPLGATGNTMMHLYHRAVGTYCSE